MTMTRRLGLFVLTLCLVAASAQAQRARVTGTVVDPDGRPARRVTVLVVDQTSVRGRAVTDSQGRFHVADLAAGRYELRVAMEGFAATLVTIALSPDDSQTVTLVLHVSAVSESVVVTAAGRELPQSRVTDSVTVVTADDIAARQFETVADALRFTVPGLGVTATGGRGGQTALFTRGGESDFTLVMIDGVRVNGFGGAFDFAHLPVGDIETGDAASTDSHKPDYMLEPDPETIFNRLIPRYLETIIYDAILESQASEHASRRMAMKSASDAANRMQKDLKKVYNRARQEGITKELLDIIGGASAV